MTFRVITINNSWDRYNILKDILKYTVFDNY